ncbi:phenylacetate--CoA ligase family protein [Dictyobacter aurantiacus]|uniref:Phenylacetate-coenzyme A ligase n=1 Tax=Dictyobacter aurantiacus TaxID=1936993 RepID=A0A401ZS99_9CHLR|nr:phenylacetate--CoA ligase [Dictyobacter aurantiacus]GCE09741.1 phenylacetate-coenzyme A ligase [Dictyobacter aurantiacus]
MAWNKEVAARDFLPIEERQQLQLRRLQHTVQRVYTSVPFYRQAMDGLQIHPSQITSLADLHRLPFTTRYDLIEHYPLGLLSVPREQLSRVHASSGTRGKAKIVGYTQHDIDIWGEVCARSLACAGLQPGDMLHNAYGYGLFTGGLGLHYGGEYLGVTIVPMSSGNTQRQVTFLKDLQPTALCCTPSYALTLAETLSALGLSIQDLNLRCGIFGAEPWTDALCQQIEDKLGLQALDIYGLSEVIGPGVAMECIQGHQSKQNGRSLHIFEDHFLPEIIDPVTGEALPYGTEGELVFTTITKEGMPLLRYRTGDLCTLSTDPCACGRTLVRMSQIKGRVDDMLIIRGINVFPAEIERILFGFSELAPYYQILVDRERTLDTLTVQAEIAANRQPPIDGQEINNGDWMNNEQVQRLQRRVSEALSAQLHLHIAVQVQPPGTLPRSEGKAVRVIDRRPT